ncbi:hypothetical protein [Streptomyces phaeofaciens]|uniref:hypothetical protein n=1 Tax=Streptomyces phaeofaciens TaxID=68254 RepID=UPI00368F3A07
MANKDWGLAARTWFALFAYKIARVWDLVLIAVVPIKEALFPSRPRSAGAGKGGLMVLAAAVGLLRTLHLARWTRPNALAVGGSHDSHKGEHLG